jgi:hypothetical protein
MLSWFLVIIAAQCFPSFVLHTPSKFFRYKIQLKYIKGFLPFVCNDGYKVRGLDATESEKKELPDCE